MTGPESIKAAELPRLMRFAAKHLGNGDASSPQGAIEHLAGSIHEGSKGIAEAIDNLAEAVRWKDK